MIYPSFCNDKWSVDFVVKRIENGMAYGDLKINGISEQFACFETVVCRGDWYKNVSVSVDDIYPWYLY